MNLIIWEDINGNIKKHVIVQGIKINRAGGLIIVLLNMNVCLFLFAEWRNGNILTDNCLIQGRSENPKSENEFTSSKPVLNLAFQMDDGWDNLPQWIVKPIPPNRTPLSWKWKFSSLKFLISKFQLPRSFWGWGFASYARLFRKRWNKRMPYYASKIVKIPVYLIWHYRQMTLLFHFIMKLISRIKIYKSFEDPVYCIIFYFSNRSCFQYLHFKDRQKLTGFFTFFSKYQTDETREKKVFYYF